jgi:hypothetical protein
LSSLAALVFVSAKIRDDLGRIKKMLARLFFIPPQP